MLSVRLFLQQQKKLENKARGKKRHAICVANTARSHLLLLLLAADMANAGCMSKKCILIGKMRSGLQKQMAAAEIDVTSAALLSCIISFFEAPPMQLLTVAFRYNTLNKNVA